MSESLNLADARLFLSVLDPEADGFTFQTFTDTKPKPRPDPLAAVRTGTLDDLAPWLASQNEKGAGIFVTVNETDGKGRKAASIKRVRAVWMEDDGAGKALPLEAHIEVESSPGKAHRYLLCDGLSADDHASVQRRLVRDYGSDPDAIDVSRVLRVPGFYHRKGTPHLVRLVKAEQFLAYPRERLIAALPPVVDSIAPATTHSVADEYVTPQQVVELRSALASIRADERGLWIRMGQALRCLGETGRGLWLEWSQTSNAWQPSDAREWDTLPHDSITYRSVFTEAQARGWVNPASGTAARASTPAEAPQLARVALQDVMAADCAEWPHVVERYFPRRVVTLLGGHGGIGKSMLALIFAAHVAAGRPWRPMVVEQSRASFLSFEDEGAIIQRRLRQIIEAYELPQSILVDGSLEVFDGSDVEAELALESDDGRGLVFTPMMDAVSEAARGAGFIVIDNSSETYGGNENVRRQVKRFIKRLAADAKENGAAVVLLAHIDKQAAKGGGKGNSYSGSTQWHNSVRSRLALVESDETGIELLHEKANYGPRQEPMILQRRDTGVLEPVARAAAMAAQEATAAILASSDAETVLELLAAVIQSGADDIPTASTGPRTTWHVLSLLPEAPAWLKGKPGKRRLEGALLALERGRRIKRVEWRNPRTRHTVQRWGMAS